MKRISVLTCASVLLIQTTAFNQPLSTGIKLGFNSATIGGQYTNGQNIQSITTFSYGVFAKFDLLDLVALQPELLYSMKGYKHIYTGQGDFYPGGSRTETGNIAYMEIPVLLKMDIPSASFGSVTPDVFAGPEAAFRLSGITKDGSSRLPDLPSTNPTDFGIVFGLGAEVNFPFTTLMIDVRYDLGVRRLDTFESNADIKNRVISFNAGIGI